MGSRWSDKAGRGAHQTRGPGRPLEKAETPPRNAVRNRQEQAEAEAPDVEATEAAAKQEASTTEAPDLEVSPADTRAPLGVFCEPDGGGCAPPPEFAGTAPQGADQERFS